MHTLQQQLQLSGYLDHHMGNACTFFGSRMGTCHLDFVLVYPQAKMNTIVYMQVPT